MSTESVRFLALFVSSSLLFANVSPGGEPTSEASPELTVRFDRDIRPILSDKCFFCHGPDSENRQADLRLDIEEAAKESVIVPGDVEASDLISRIRTDDADLIMPPAEAHKELTEGEIELLSTWIAEGAHWTQHWAFIPPTSPEVPNASESQHVRGVIDAFIQQRLKKEGLSLSAEANREQLIRRVTFDLTGLPPTLAEVDAFVNDRGADAYEKVVDRLLKSPRFGERMAVMWMDAARYGDTSVYHADGPRDMWAWRDAIVDAYNRNQPFDEFSIDQLAGDLLPDASLEDRILAGFNRNNGTTDEGGAIAEEYRVEYAVDRVKTTSMVWLGLTMECAQCHDHKYDAISQEDYYRFYAFFNVSRDGGMQTRRGNAEPILSIPDPEKERKLPGVQMQLANARQDLEKRAVAAESDYQAWLKNTADSFDEKTIVQPTVNVPLLAGSGDTVSDLASSREGKIKGKVEWVDTRSDTGLKLDGNNFVDLGDVASFERTDSFSYGGWVKPQKGQTGALLARMDESDDFRGYDMLVGDGPVSVHVIHSWPNNAIKVITKKKLKPNQWHHVVATYDGSSKAKGVKIYVDGEEWEWKIEQNGLSDTIVTKKSLLIGRRHDGSRLRAVVDSVQVFDQKLEASEVADLHQRSGVRALLAIEPKDRTDQQNKALRDYFLTSEDKVYGELKKRIDGLAKQEVDLKKPLTSIMVMGDMEKPRETFVLNRGAYDSPTERKVEPTTLTSLPPMANDAPRNRLGLANWLFRDDHPLTARVAVNRYWQTFFGTGLVSTPGDFGAQGDFPSHPELLDWLAVDFRESGWDIKRMVKQILMSGTYRQTSAASPDLYRRDPDNRLYARGPRFRLQGEFIRDNALSVSGLLVGTIGGPGVKPYQPKGLWAEVGLGGNPKFVQDHGEKLYRRSLYTYWKRSAPPPSMQIFDAPTREKCTIKRARTNTPLQALTTMNDIQFVEAARHFAERFVHEGGRTADNRIEYAFRLATARRPNDRERNILQTVFSDSLAQYQNDVEAAKALLAVGESERDATLDVAHHAAWTIVASAILNLDETLTRE